MNDHIADAVDGCVTADTITDAQIRELRRTYAIQFETMSLAIVGKGQGPDRSARAHCAEILNARSAP